MNVKEFLANNIGDVEVTPKLIKQMAQVKKLAIQTQIEKLKLKAELLEEVTKELEEWARKQVDAGSENAK